MDNKVCIFGEGFKYEPPILFSLNKPKNYTPVKNFLASIAAPNQRQGECRRPCEPSDCDPATDPECFASSDACECFHSQSYPNGRCDVGTFCPEISGKVCSDCCQPGEGAGFTCRKTWLEPPWNMSGKFVDTLCGNSTEFEEGDTQANFMGSLDTGGEWLKKYPKCCKPCSEGGMPAKCCDPAALPNDIPRCLDASGNPIPYELKENPRQRTGCAMFGKDRNPLMCWCPGKIEYGYDCQETGDAVQCVPKTPTENPKYSNIDDCNRALEYGECGVRWKCEEGRATNGGTQPCTQTKDPADETKKVYSKKEDCEKNCKVGWMCTVEGDVAKCVEGVGGDYPDEPTCLEAMRNDECGINWRCSADGSNPKCVPTMDSWTGASTYAYNSESICNQLCMVKYKCVVKGDGTMGCDVAPSTSVDEGDRYDTIEECNYAVEQGNCNNLGWNCAFDATGENAECKPDARGPTYGKYDTRSLCEAECGVKYECDVTGGTGCKKVLAPDAGPDAYSDYDTCCGDCCGCDKALGKCEYKDYTKDYVLCASGVTRAWCSRQVRSKFTCCKDGCECPDCPPGQPAAACTSSEVKVVKDFYLPDGSPPACYCECLKSHQRSIEGQDACVECGENSTFSGGGAPCQCNDGYETAGGNPTPNFKEWGPSEAGVPGTDGYRTAYFEGCVPKKYKCDISKSPPECAAVAYADRDSGSFDGSYECDSAGCGSYNCVNEKCEPADINNGGPPGQYPNKSECEKVCGMYECVDGTCIQSNLVTPGPGIYQGKDACEKAGCGRYNCESGQCVPSLTGHYPAKTDCENSSCGDFLCVDKGVASGGKTCEQDLGGANGAASQSTSGFPDMPACIASGCQKYKCAISDGKGKCKSDPNGEYPTLNDCLTAGPPCECKAGEELCPDFGNNRKCVPKCTAPQVRKYDPFKGCSCEDCQGGVVRKYNGHSYCCPKCPAVKELVNGQGVNIPDGIFKADSQSDANPCGTCCEPSDDQFAYIVDRKTCKSCRSCPPGSKMNKEICDCPCNREAGYWPCNNTCKYCPPPRVYNEAAGCSCYCAQSATDPNRNPQCRCGLNEKCECAPDLVPPTSCDQVKYLPNGTCYVGRIECPDDQVVQQTGKDCACVCRNGNPPPLGGLPCDNNQPGPAGPFPPKGGGGGGGGGGDGGGSSTSGSSSTSNNPCGSNAYSLNKQCYCNYPAAILVNGSCQCADGYPVAADGITCVDPSTQPGGNDGIGGSLMRDLEPDFTPQRSACDDVICPPGQCCHGTVFGFECKKC